MSIVDNGLCQKTVPPNLAAFAEFYVSAENRPEKIWLGRRRPLPPPPKNYLVIYTALDGLHEHVSVIVV